jgi:class 3 adenylate cyclase/tetratricopeptide (TPR) repeat protein
VDVLRWLAEQGLEQYAEAFVANAIDGDVLRTLTEDDLKELGVWALGHRKRLLQAIAALREEATPAHPFTRQAPTAPIGTAERRQLTVLFCDLVGSTELSARLDPEDLREIIGTYRGACAEVIGRFEGHVAKFLGDGVLALFGWPRAHEDDAERAVRAGLALVEVIAQLEAGSTAGLQVRVGVATGPVVVGDLVGQGSADADAVVGETPNLAARLQTLAEPGTLVISRATRRLVGNLFQLDDLGPQRLKGFAEPITVWRVAGEIQGEGRFEARHTAGLTALVGREEEIAQLLRRWQQAKGGEGQVVLLSGEPGIGKSRLVRELRARLPGEPHIALFYQCSPYHSTSPLHPLIKQLERAAGFERDDPLEAKLDKLEVLLARGGVELEQGLPLVASLLGLPAEASYGLPELTPRRQKQLTLEALADQLEGLSAAQPLLLVYEDVHWIDPTTQELLALTVERTQRLPVLLLITFRPEFNPSWIGQPHVSALPLSRLGRCDGAAMVDRVAGAKALPPELNAEIVAKTDGVPLFVEELTKQVLESGHLTDAGDHYELAGPLPPLAIPASLNESLLARLDRLAPVKDVAQIGAAIGREFSHALVAAVADRPEAELQGALDRLVSSELVFRRGTPPEATYAFKHALVQDVAYESLLKSRRQQLHAKIAAVLEERWPETKELQPELLARHYAGAGLPERAVSYWRRAAARAIGRFANLEAIAHCDAAVAQLRAMPPSTERVRAELEVQLAKGVAVRAGRGYSVPESEQVFLRACELCEELDDRVRLVHALRGLFGFYYVAARWTDAAEVADRICAAAEGLEDRVALCTRWTIDGAARLFRGEPAEAVARLREALQHYDDEDRETHIRLTGHEMASLIRFHLAIAEWLVGLPERAARTAEEAVGMARRVTQPFSLGQALGNSALLHVLSREWDAAEVLAAETIEVSVHHGIPDYIAFGGALAGTVAAAKGDAAKGAALAREGMAGLRRTGWQCFVPILQVQLAAALGTSGEADAALGMADEALQMIRSSGELTWEAEALRVLGEAKLATGTANSDEVEADLRAAVQVAECHGANAFQLRAATSLARLLAEQGKRREGRDLLARIYGRFTEGFHAPDLLEARELLEALRAAG